MYLCSKKTMGEILKKYKKYKIDQKERKKQGKQVMLMNIVIL